MTSTKTYIERYTYRKPSYERGATQPKY